ncbi:histidine kinase [Anaeromicropila populeti]|uniref:Histidine kinase-, DNA gyrase B-, and HSP90-like ATPase n=1 Tax=Anaeromicropila populeti TaxID=37658 RepID=A0A1I6JVR2_9FIRM|nr:histidine kinase [Anaeromicropila populeti]SFR83084.1 Histidine kinase-, DNA gyrase B-, and HSP90-like ATPase [Anaeromicropila populeti]
MKKDTYAKLVLVVVFGLLLCAVFFLFGKYRKVIMATDGYVDLTKENFTEDIISLNGEWEFYSDEYRLSDFQPSAYITVPYHWNSRQNRKLNMNEDGFGTYRLKVLLPKEGNYLMHVPFIPSAYKLFINGEEIEENGRLSGEGIKESAIWKPQNVVFYTSVKEIEVVFWVSNYYCSQGGIINPILIGSYKTISYDTTMNIIRSAFIMGMFAGLGLYLLLLFKPKTSNSKYLLLGVFCIIAIVLESIIGSYVIEFFWTNIAYDVLVKVEYISFAGCMLTLVNFFIYSYPHEIKKPFYKIVQVMNWVYLLFIIFGNENIFSITALAYTYLLIINVIFIFVLIIKALLHKIKYAGLSMVSVVVIFITIALDVLKINKLPYAFSRSGNYILGLLFFLICQMYVLSRENIDALEQAKKAKEMEIAFLQAQIAPHFFFNTMNNIYCMMETSVEQAKSLILDFCAFLRVKHRFDYRKNTYYSLHEEIDLIQSYVKIENSRFQGCIDLRVDVDEEGMKIMIPQLLLQPIVENAIKHGFAGKQLIISIKGRMEGKMFIISVQDNGRGMEEKSSVAILNNQSSSSGIGLKNINYRLEKCYKTKMQIESKLEEGTKIWFKIPVNTAYIQNGM